jgi:glycosyltransferase involved in cell wall biosynthesis
MAPIAPGDIWVVIPAYNESEVIASVLEPLLTENYRVVVVDDGSTDSTFQSSRTTGAYVLRHATNLGQGAALQTGISFALLEGANFICTYDADGQHNPDDIRRLAQYLADANADVALGSRFLGGTENLPFIKRLVLKAAIVFTGIHSGLKLTDTHNGLRLMTEKAARSIRLRQPRMAHASEVLVKISERGLKYVEVPVKITYTEYSRQKGQSVLDSAKIVFDLLIARRLR